MFAELTHHLLDKYGDVPRFMASVWLRNDRPSWRYRDWYVHLGRGHNLRTAKSPVALTKKMAHNFLQAPDDYTPEQAIRWGQMHALGASKSLIDRIVATRLGQSFEHETFWFTVLRFFAENPMLDPRQVGPIIDYLHNQKFQGAEVEVAPGEWAPEPPPQPGLSMQGRTVTTLLQHVETWHRGLGRFSKLPTEKYARPNFDGITIERQTAKGYGRWTIRQLLNAQALQVESESLRHCVSSYHWSCASGRCTIWSLSFAAGKTAAQRRQTIEVDRNGVVVQCRGLANRDPNSEEWVIVSTWASEANLQISSYL